MVFRWRLPAGIDVQLISSKPKLVQMRRSGPRGVPQSTRTVTAEAGLVDTRQMLLLASASRKGTLMRDHDDVDPAASHPTRRSLLQAGLLTLGATQLPDIFVARAYAQGP